MSHGPTQKRAAHGQPPSESDWRKTLIAEHGSVQEAVHCLEASGMQIVLVISAGGSLVGTVTDGDIRRGLLRGLDLGSPVSSILRREPLVVPAGLERETVLQLMHANGIGAIPVVDSERRVVRLHLLNELVTPPQRSNLLVVMAGGKGVRLRPHTEKCPKPMLHVRGKPILEHIIERAKAEGFRHFVLAVHYLGHVIEEYFGDGSKWQVKIDYLRERDPMGTAGALTLLTSHRDKPLLVTNGDVLTDIRFGELLDFHTGHHAAATMAVRLHEWQNPFGVVRTTGVDIVGFEEKPIARSYINAGIYALEPVSLECLSPDEACDMPTLFARLHERGARTIVFPVHEPWLDAGNPGDFERAQSEYSPTL